MRLWPWIASFLIGIFSSVLFAAQPVKIQEGVHYLKIPGILGKPPSEKIEVIEFFSYGCPHCYHFDSSLQTWAQNASLTVDFVRMPVIFRPDWEIYAALYYTLDLLGKLPTVHPKIFKAIHEEGQALQTVEELVPFLAKQGIKPAELVNTLDSFAVRTKIDIAHKKALKFQVSAVPLIVVNGRYLVHGGLAGSYEGMLAVLDHLVAKELKATKQREAQVK